MRVIMKSFSRMFRLFSILFLALYVATSVSNAGGGGRLRGPKYRFDRERTVLDDEEKLESVNLLTSKKILNTKVVENMDVIIKYDIYNLSPKFPAFNVNLKDDSFEIGKDFAVVAGGLDVYFEKILPNQNVSHVVVLKPLLYGYYNFTAAKVIYYPRMDLDESTEGWSAEPGRVYIVNYNDYNKKHSYHLMDWTAFAVMTACSVLVPYLLWVASKAKYDDILESTKWK